jgi:hypothetical protein
MLSAHKGDRYNLLKVTHAKNEIKWKKRRKIPDHQSL